RLENLAKKSEPDLAPDELHAIFFALAILRALPQNVVSLLDSVLDLASSNRRN
ncbi:unnamed protein product, partial [marine sediment metagenome]